MVRRLLDRTRSIALGAVVLLLACAALIWVFLEEEKPKKDRLQLAKAEFSDLTSWTDDELTQFLPALLLSCQKMMRLPDARSLGGNKIAGTVADWKEICKQAPDLPLNSGAIRSFLEAKFTPFNVTNNTDSKGLFTGYYEASLQGSRTPSDIYKIPLYSRPDELVMVHLGRFRDGLKGQRVAGVVKNGELRPFADRKKIDDGALAGQDLEIVWVDSAVDAFFLHIQGSGRVSLNDGSALRVGYAGQNGHPYFAIGKTLIENGDVPREKMSMQAIRDWLEGNPHKADELMQKNASYIFFRELKTSGPIGAQGVELTPERSLAVDRKWMPLGVPIWLETEVFDGPHDTTAEPFNHLLMAQDTGGAIRGPVRGDVFWGNGDRAYEKAGAMKSTGKYWIFLPNAVAKRHLSKNND
ncbi:MAG: MltA domain-containing protein [Sneathiella sp.]|nr:MltA domain-containing protein [Sneathiella sp.]